MSILRSIIFRTHVSRRSRAARPPRLSHSSVWVGHGPKNRFYRATRELGRVFKTEFILDYLIQSAQSARSGRTGRGRRGGKAWRGHG